MDKHEALKRIAQEIINCKTCRIDKIGKPVPGEGSPNAKLMFIGEAPGKTEAATGHPFTGRSGKLLRSEIIKLGLDDQKEVFITSTVKYLPASGKPSIGDIAHGMEHTIQQLEVINPKITVLLGAVSVLGCLHLKNSVNKFHGSTINKNGRKYFIMFHPAAALRSEETRNIFRQDFLKLKNLIKEQGII